MTTGLVGSEMCIRDSPNPRASTEEEEATLKPQDNRRNSAAPFPGSGVLLRLLLHGHPDRGGHAGDVQAGYAEPAAHAGQVPLRLQPARLLQGHPGRLPHQEGAGGEQEDLHQVSACTKIAYARVWWITETPKSPQHADKVSGSSKC